MKITVFCGNQPRHVALIRALASVSDELFAVQECTTLFPGQIDDFYGKSEAMAKYFARVIEAEREVFGTPGFSPKNVRSLAMKAGDLNRLAVTSLAAALESDLYVVFGASYLKGALARFLISRRALNIHMGFSPYYRGSSCNFWALYDGRPDCVGATIHQLTDGLDSGPILFHAFPRMGETPTGFILGMSAVRAAIAGLVHYLTSGELGKLEPVAQDKTLELRYSRHEDFTDAVAAEYLQRELTPEKIGQQLAKRVLERCVRPFLG